MGDTDTLRYKICDFRVPRVTPKIGIVECPTQYSHVSVLLGVNEDAAFEALVGHGAIKAQVHVDGWNMKRDRDNEIVWA